MTDTVFSNNTPEGLEIIFQIYETMLIYKCKGHCGRSHVNRKAALCIFESQGIVTREFATIIPEKAAGTFDPLICLQTAPYSVILPEKHRSYNRVSSFNFIQVSVCHKYEFVNYLTGVNTRAIKSFHNELKLEIRRKKT